MMGKVTNTAGRLHEIMTEQNLKQADIIRSAEAFAKQYGETLSRSDISQYCSGKNEPSQDKIFLLAAALNVNESWLMGWDVPRERQKAQSAQIPVSVVVDISDLDRELIDAFHKADIMTQRNIFKILDLDEKNLYSESSMVV